MHVHAGNISDAEVIIPEGMKHAELFYVFYKTEIQNISQNLTNT